MIDVDWSVMGAHGSGYCFETVRGEGAGARIVWPCRVHIQTYSRLAVASSQGVGS